MLPEPQPPAGREKHLLSDVPTVGVDALHRGPGVPLASDHPEHTSEIVSDRDISVNADLQRMVVGRLSGAVQVGDPQHDTKAIGTGAAIESPRGIAKHLAIMGGNIIFLKAEH